MGDVRMKNYVPPNNPYNVTDGKTGGSPPAELFPGGPPPVPPVLPNYAPFPPVPQTGAPDELNITVTETNTTTVTNKVDIKVKLGPDDLFKLCPRD